MYLHDFQCPSCQAYFNEITGWPYPSGDKWCSGCNVVCPHDQTFQLVSRVQQPFGGASQQAQQPFGSPPQHQEPQTQQVMAPVSRYDRQLVVKLTNTSSYSPVDNAGTALHNKAKSKGLASDVIALDPRSTTIPSEIKQKFRELTNKSRLYIIGHGEGSTIQGVLALNLAYTVCFTWGVQNALRVTLVSCKAGEKVETAFGDFAKAFHSSLWRPGRLATEVAAYTRSISVTTAALAKLKGMPSLEGRKVFYSDDVNVDWMLNDGDNVKVIWFWDSKRTKQQFRNRSQDRAGRKG